MALAYACGGECGAPAAVPVHIGAVGGNAPTFDTTIKRTGDRSIRLAATTGTSNYRIDNGTLTAIYGGGLSQSTPIFVGTLYFRFETSLPSALVTLLFCQDLAAFGDYLGIKWDPADNTIRALKTDWLGGTQVSGASAGVANQTSVWYRLDWRINMSANPWLVDVQLNGNAATQFSLAHTAATSINIAFGPALAATFDIYLDDIQCSQTTGDYPLSGGQVHKRLPTSPDGSHNVSTGNFQYNNGVGVTNSTTDVYTQLDDATVPQTGGATDSVSQILAAATEYVEIQFEDTPASVGTLRAVTVIAARSEAATGLCTYQIRLRDNGSGNEATVLDHNNVAGSTSVRPRTGCYPTAPGGGAWSNTIFDALRLRFGYGSDVDPIVRLNGVMLEVAYAEPSGTTVTLDVASAAAISTTNTQSVNTVGAISAQAQQDVSTVASISTLIQADVSTVAAISVTAQASVDTVASITTTVTISTDVATVASVSMFATASVSTTASIAIVAQIDALSVASISVLATQSVATIASITSAEQENVATVASIALQAVCDVLTAASVSVLVQQDIATTASVVLVGISDVLTAASINVTATASVATTASISAPTGLNVLSAGSISLLAVQSVSTTAAISTLNAISVTSVASVAANAAVLVASTAALAVAVTQSVTSVASIAVVTYGTVNVSTVAAISTAAYVDINTVASLGTLVNPPKQVLYHVYSPVGIRLGVWSDVAILPRFRRDINSGASTLSVHLPRSTPTLGMRGEAGSLQDIRNGNRVEVYVVDRESGPNGILVYKGIIREYSYNVPEGGLDVLVVSRATNLKRRWISENEAFTLTDMDPSDMMQYLINNDLLPGVTWDATNPLCGFRFTQTFSKMNVGQALDIIRSLAGAQWYYEIRANETLKFNHFDTTVNATHTIAMRNLSHSEFRYSTLETYKRVVVYGALDPITGTRIESAVEAPGYDSTVEAEDFVFTDERIIDNTTALRTALAWLNIHQEQSIETTQIIPDSNFDLGFGYDIESVNPGDTIQLNMARYANFDLTRWDYFYWDFDVWGAEDAGLIQLPFVVTSVEYHYDHIQVSLTSRPNTVIEELSDVIDKQLLEGAT